jgi:ATP-dependent Clp protease ATP-binding subunit ClpA
MFERFSDRARRVVVLSQEEARILNHSYIGTEHMLAALIHEGKGIACRALESCGVTPQGVRDQIVEIIGLGQAQADVHIPFTPRAKEVFEFALREALDRGHRSIGTEHLLLGLLRDVESVACQIIARLGADLDELRRRVVLLIDEDSVVAETRVSSEPFETFGVRLSSVELGRDPTSFPLCRRCGASLVDSLSFRLTRARAAEGHETRNALLLFCGTCGSLVVGEIIPEEG